MLTHKPSSSYLLFPCFSLSILRASLRELSDSVGCRSTVKERYRQEKLCERKKYSSESPVENAHLLTSTIDGP